MSGSQPIFPPRVQVADAPALGCAILAAVAAGLFPDVPAACAAMVHQVRGAGWGKGAQHAALCFRVRLQLLGIHPTSGMAVIQPWSCSAA